jgi:hypothetical protein
LHWNRCSRTFKTKLSRSPNCSSWINKASHLEHVAPIVIFLALFCRIRTACLEGLICAPMLWLTSIDLLFHGNLRSNWVVIVVLELLSLTCPGPDLGSCYVTSYYLCHPCYCYGYVDPSSVENRIWGDGNGICWCVANGSRFVQCDAGSLWIIIIPKSKDRFMERPPMKIVQPLAYMGMAWRSMW